MLKIRIPVIAVFLQRNFQPIGFFHPLIQFKQMLFNNRL